MNSTPRTQSAWKEKVPSDKAWKGRTGRSREALAAEQDHAAGGRHRRFVDLGDGRLARASVELKVLPNTRRIRAYLRWSDHGKSPAKYLGQVDRNTRIENLIEAWEMAWEKRLVCEQTLPPGSWAASPAVRASMRGNRGRDTRPEILLRKLLHSRGFRYRVSTKPLAGVRRTADLVFSGPRVAVFVDGCFWHGCPEHYRPAATNSDFWREKIERNRERDLETNRLLQEAGWRVVRAWEHEDPEDVASRVGDLVRR